MFADERFLLAILFGAGALAAWGLSILRGILTSLQAIRQTQDVVIERLDRLISK